jgi:RHS repeat-associated protein
VAVLKIDIGPTETNTCVQQTSGEVKLTADSYWAGDTVGNVNWSSSPGSLGTGSGDTFTFNPSNATPTSYVVTAEASVLTSCSDTCTVRVLKVDIEPTETNTCRHETFATVKLKTDCYWGSDAGGDINWSSSPSGLMGSGIGNTFTFYPNTSAPTEYVVTAQSTLLPNYTDICTVRVYTVDIVSTNFSRIPCGDWRTLTAVSQATADRVDWTVTWIEDNPSEPLIGTPAAGTTVSGSNLTITVDDLSGPGRAIVRATHKDYPACYHEAEIPIGCPPGGACASCTTVAGGLLARVHSMDAQISLGRVSGGEGKTPGGSEAGYIKIFAEEPSADMAKPPLKGSLINYSRTPRSHGDLTSTNSGAGTDVETINQTEGVGLRQILVAQALVDIRTNSEYQYTMDFFRPSDIETKTNGLYALKGGAEPYKAFVVENPNGSADYNTLRIVEYNGGVANAVITNEYVWAEVAGTPQWTLTTGNGLKSETVSTEIDGDDTIKTRTVSGGTGGPVSKSVDITRTFAWGDAPVQNVTDPDGAALTSSTYYYESPGDSGRYSRISLQVAPNGSWTRHDYDTAGRQTVVISSWKDAPTNAAENEARAVYYDYAPVDMANDTGAVNPSSPRTITEKALGITVGKTFYSYYMNGSGDRVEIVERCPNASASFGASGNQRTTTIHNEATSDPVAKYQVQSVAYPDGRKDTYTYEYGTCNTNSAPYVFTAGSGDYRRITTIHGTTANPNGIANKTTKDTSIENPLGQAVMRESWVCTGGSSYERISWEIAEFDVNNHPVKTIRSDGTVSETAWGCCGKEWEKDANGTERTYSYDDLKRADISTKQADDPVIASYAFDAMGRTLTNTVNAGGLVQTTSMQYDLAGRTIQSVDAAGLVTTTDYSDNGRKVTTVGPGSATNTAESYLDGRTKSVSGNAVTPSCYDYGVNSDGSQWTVVYTGPTGSNSPSWTKTTVDLLGRTIREERPGFSVSSAPSVVTNASFYNSSGQLVKTTSPGSSDTLYEYDELGNQIRSGLDVDNDGTLDLGENDRITENDSYYEEAEDGWFRVSASAVYATAGSSVATTNSIQTTRLTGLGSSSDLGLLTSESYAIDVYGNITISRTYTDRSAKTVTQTVTYPDSTNDAVSITVNGLLVSSSTRHSTLPTLYSYDALERQTGVTDPRTGTSTMHYNSLGQVDWTQDAASNTTAYAYDSATGRRISTTDALGNTVYTAYDVKGLVVGTWGATYPVAYDFDDFGRMSAMYTYRGTNVISSYADLANLKSSMDKTAWLYDLATGLLTNKLYADNTGPTYTYTADGKLATRTWARGLTTTYRYDSCCGAMTNIDYSDSTPDVSFTMNRMGQQATITDATGTRTFTYNDALQLASETNAMGTITRQYDSLGRSSGFYVGPDLASAPYSVAYGYDGVGRMNSVLALHSLGDGGSSSNVANYSYLPDSDLLSEISNPQSGIHTTKSYEPHRNLIAEILNQAGTNVISRFQYSNDALGRRTQRIDNASLTNAFGYNTRSELTNAVMNMDTFAYQYDPIGNRTLSVEGGSPATPHCYTANALNQYTEITNGGLRALSYDLDGNITNDGVFAYSWDAENRLSQISNSQYQITFAYDYMSRRVEKVAGSTTNSFLYDSWNLISEISNQGSQIATNAYVWGLDLSGTLQGAGGIGGLLAVSKISNNSISNHFPCADANGNITDLISTNGSLVAHYEYDPYGNLVSEISDPEISNPFKFSSKYLDAETGLYYYGFRYYKPECGRFLNRDPLEEQGSLNIYSLVFNSPIIDVDPFGLIILGDDKIIALDKTYPRSQIDLYSTTSLFGCWETEGQLAILGPNFGSSVVVYPTGESAYPGDSVVRASTPFGDEALHVTVRRPKFLSRRVGSAVRVTLGSTTWYWPSLAPLFTSYDLQFLWLIQDQFGDPLAGVTVGERISNMVLVRVASRRARNRTGVGTTDSRGIVPDEYYLTFRGAVGGSFSFDQTLIIGNWEADTSSILSESGGTGWTGSSTATFH